jgi:choline dehydrogenase-like flavoprotein
VAVPQVCHEALDTAALEETDEDIQRDADNLVRAWPRGKCLGGSIAINYQMYARGHVVDYDDWAKLGNESWDFKSLLPYFKKHEHLDDLYQYTGPSNIPLETKYDADFHGQNGPIHTSFSTWRFPGEREWIAASSKLGDKMGSTMNAWSGDNL